MRFEGRCPSLAAFPLGHYFFCRESGRSTRFLWRRVPFPHQMMLLQCSGGDSCAIGRSRDPLPAHYRRTGVKIGPQILPIPIGEKIMKQNSPFSLPVSFSVIAGKITQQFRFFRVGLARLFKRPEYFSIENNYNLEY